MIRRYCRPLAWLVALSFTYVHAAVAAPATESMNPKGENAEGHMFVYVGTYTRGNSKGIYRLRFDPVAGTLSQPSLAAEISSPSFLAIHPNRRFLYAISEGGPQSSGVSAFAIDPAAGALTLLNQVHPGGRGLCHVSVDNEGKNALVASYGSGSVAVLPIADDGRLRDQSAFVQHVGRGPDPKRQDGPHAHQIVLDPPGKFAFVPDLGLDKVFIYRFDPAAGTLSPNDPAFATLDPGCGPRHIAFHPSGKFAYVATEMGATVTAFRYDADHGALATLQTLDTVPSDFHGLRWAAEVAVHPSGRFVYVSNRTCDNIATFAVDPATGKLTLIGFTPSGGKTPRHFALDPTGSWLIAGHQDSPSLVLFRIDPAKGVPTPTGTAAEVSSAVCVVFLPER